MPEPQQAVFLRKSSGFGGRADLVSVPLCQLVPPQDDQSAPRNGEQQIWMEVGTRVVHPPLVVRWERANTVAAEPARPLDAVVLTGGGYDGDACCAGLDRTLRERAALAEEGNAAAPTTA